MAQKRTRRSPEQKIAEAQAKVERATEKLKAEKAALAAEQSKVKKKERAADTRRCVIAGRYALKHMDANPDSDFAKTLGRLLDEYVTRAADREVLDLSPAPDKAPKRGRPSNDTSRLASQFPAEPETA